MSPSLSTLFKTQSNPKTNCLKQLQRTCACFPTGKHLIPTNESSLLKTVKQPDRPILKSRELSVNSWTQSHLPKCFPKYFSRLHKYTIEWLRFKWSRIRIHFGPWFSFGMLFLFNWRRKNYFWRICVKATLLSNLIFVGDAANNIGGEKWKIIWKNVRLDAKIVVFV